MSNPRCLTRVVIDDDCGVEVAQLQSVMQRIQSMLHDVPQAQREYIANALLNLAVSRMVKEEGMTQTVAITCSLRPEISYPPWRPYTLG
jgi:hypothetical protein